MCCVCFFALGVLFITFISLFSFPNMKLNPFQYNSFQCNAMQWQLSSGVLQSVQCVLGAHDGGVFTLLLLPLLPLPQIRYSEHHCRQGIILSNPIQFNLISLFQSNPNLIHFIPIHSKYDTIHSIPFQSISFHFISTTIQINPIQSNLIRLIQYNPIQSN